MTDNDIIPASAEREADVHRRISELTVSIVQMNATLASMKASAECEGRQSEPEHLERRRRIVGALGWKQTELARLKQMLKLKDLEARRVVRDSENGYDPDDCVSLIGALVALTEDLYDDMGSEWAHEDLVLVQDARSYIGRAADSVANALASGAPEATR